MVRVKICGITNLADALQAIDSGADALGFVFYKKSPRYISPEKAASIIKSLPAGILKAGVFVNAEEKELRRTAKLCKLDMLQLHGDEGAEFCKKFSGYKIIKALRVKGKCLAAAKLCGYKPFAYLFDTFVRSKRGGSGKKFDWDQVGKLADKGSLIFLSGGLNAGNVQKAIKQAHPDWVDASSLLESSPGKKEHKKVKDFIRSAKGKRGKHVTG